MDNKGNSLQSVQADMKIAILHTIAKAIYASPTMKIREAVSNSMDNGATGFVIFIDPSTGTLSLFDDGKGIAAETFKTIFQSMGYGLYKNEEDRLSYFGLGLMSVFRLGAKAKIFTRTAKDSELLLLEVNTDGIFEKENENKSISYLENFIVLAPSDLRVRKSLSPLTEVQIKNIFGDIPASFTEIVIEGVYPSDLTFILGEDAIEDLRKFLPLKTDESEPFLLMMKDPIAKEKINDILNDVDYCPTLDVHFGISGEKELVPLWKYYPTGFKETLEFADSNIWAAKKADFAYYILFTTEDLEPRGKENAETGFWVRNKNFLVKPADFFQRPGFKRRIAHEPLSNWMFGEIFHKNMQDFIVVPRNDYVWDSEQFEKFRNDVAEIIKDLNKLLRSAWQYGNEIANAVVTPFQEIGERTGPFYKAKDKLIRAGIIGKDDDVNPILDMLKKQRRPEIENEDYAIDTLIKKGVDPILLTKNSSCIVTIDQTITEVFTKSIEAKTNRAVIKISPLLFSPRKVTFLDNTFHVFFVAGTESDPGVSVNVDDRKIFVNPFNHDIMSYSVSFVDLYIALELSDILSADKAEMKHFLLRLLGMEYKDSTPFLGPLSDDLKRKKRS